MNLKLPISLLKFERRFILLFLIVTIGFYNENFLLIVRIFYILIFSYFILKLLIDKRVINRGYFVFSILFLFYCFLSNFWSKSPEYSWANYLNLVKYVLLSIALSNFCKDKESTYYILKSIAFAGLIYCLYFYIKNVNINQLYTANSRISDIGTPINVLGTIASLCSIVFLFLSLIEKNRWYIILFIIGFIILILTGSRKSIIALLLGSLIIIYASSSRNKIYLTLLLVVLIWSLFSFANSYYMYLLSRFQDLQGVFKPSFELIGSDADRFNMIRKGIQFFWDSPLWGNGFYSYPILYEKHVGILSYAHNNYIEILVDLGLIGFLIYYSIFFFILRKVNKKIGYNQQTLILTLIVMLLFSQIAIVFILDRFTWLLLPVLYASSKYHVNEDSFHLE